MELPNLASSVQKILGGLFDEVVGDVRRNLGLGALRWVAVPRSNGVVHVSFRGVEGYSELVHEF